MTIQVVGSFIFHINALCHFAQKSDRAVFFVLASVAVRSHDGYCYRAHPGCGNCPGMATTSSRGLTRMSASERLDSKAGPLGNMSQTYFGGLDTIAKGFEPALKGVGRWNLEVLGFMARRA